MKPENQLALLEADAAIFALCELGKYHCHFKPSLAGHVKRLVARNEELEADLERAKLEAKDAKARMWEVGHENDRLRRDLEYLGHPQPSANP